MSRDKKWWRSSPCKAANWLRLMPAPLFAKLQPEPAFVTRLEVRQCLALVGKCLI